jgi:hypothetical protein
LLYFFFVHHHFGRDCCRHLQDRKQDKLDVSGLYSNCEIVNVKKMCRIFYSYYFVVEN